MTLRVVLTITEIALLVAVVCFFLIVLTRMLSRIGDTLTNIADGVKAIDSHATIVGPGTDQLNELLTGAAGSLEQATVAAETLGPLANDVARQAGHLLS